MANWLDKYEQGGLVLKKKTKDNYGKKPNVNDVQASVGPDFVGLGYNTKGRDYSPAWGGQFQDGGEIPQAQNGWLEKLTSTLNPYNWRVEDYSKEKDFTKAYSTAKKAGEEEFMYKGKRYNTKYAGTPRQEVGTYGVDGKPVHPIDLNHPAQVNLYPAFGKYLPGHISASVGDNETSIDYSSRGNFPFGINEVKNKGEKSFNVYGQDNLTFSNKAASLPTGDYMLEDKYTPSDWNLFTNNCADNVCDAFGIPRSKGIQTPSSAVSKIKKKYPTLDITGKAYEDYYHLSEKLQSSFPEKILPQAKNILGIASSPDLKKLKPKFISSIQQALYESGYELPKSKLKNNNNFDGILGDETKTALLDWQKKNKSLAMGGALPGAVGFTYARTQDPAPANGKYTKKTKASAQNGSVIKDNMGQWAHPGEVTEIDSNNITMQGVDYPVLGISDTGDTQMMQPNQDYKFDGEKVTEFPIAQNGDWLSKYATEPMRQDATRVAPPVLKLTDEEKLANVAKSDQAQKRALNTAKEVIAERKKNKATKGDLNTPGSWHTEDKARLFPNSPGGAGEVFDEYINPATYVGVLADALGESVTARDPKGIATSLALAAGTGALGIDPLGSTIKGVKAIPKATRAGLNAIDRNFSDVGQRLAYIEKKGLEKGWNPQMIKEDQLEKVGITSSQREAYVPGVSDFLSKYVTPFGYKGVEESKLTQTLNNIKNGGPKYLPEYGSAVNSRKDSWNLFLGKPQQNRTFRVANTSPINHPAYTPEQLSNIDIYSLNGLSNNIGIKPREFNQIEDPITYYAQDMSSLEGSIHMKNPLKHNIDLLENGIVNDIHFPVMGGYNKRLSETGLDYNDIWDLEPTVKNPITKKPMKVKIDNFIGKPFMSHGVFPEVTTESVSKNLNEIINSELENATNRQRYSPLKITEGKPKLSETPIVQKINPDGTVIEMYDELDNFIRTSKDIKNLSNIKDRLKNIPKKEKGGWLNKYK